MQSIGDAPHAQSVHNQDCGKTCYISCNESSMIHQAMKHPTLINICVHLPQILDLLTAFPTSLSKQQDKNIPLLSRLGLGARSRILTDVSIMVMAKSCLYQTQHSGLTITANGHICHGTKIGALSVCVACVLCAFVLFLFFFFHLHGVWF